jgi:hypothetical protein
MCHIAPICIFFGGLRVFSYIVSHYLYLCGKFLCHIVLICVELKFITHARIEVITHAHRMLRAFYTVAAVIS